jgi:hypothetical protein
MDDDLWRLRLRRDGFRIPDPWNAAGGSPAFLGKVTSTGTNLGVNKFFLANPVDATGAETESGAGTLTANASISIPVLAIGPTAPATGDFVVCRHVNYRWVAEKQTVGGGGGGGTSGFIACCPSDPMPTTVSLSFAFRAGTTNAADYDNQYQDMSLTYSLTEPAFAGSNPALGRWYSALAPIGSSFGTQFGYSVFCSTGGVFTLGVGQLNTSNGFWGGYHPCKIFSSRVCAPFIATGIAFSGGGTGTSCPDGFGGGTGDNMTVS